MIMFKTKLKENKEYIKSILIVLLTQAIVYFLLKNIIREYYLITPKINFPIVEELVIIYNTWYPLIFITSFITFKTNKTIYKSLIYSFIISIILAIITYVIYPTVIERPIIEVNNFMTYLLDLTYRLDTPAVHCIPSMHCLLSFITIYYITINKNITTKIKLFINLYLLTIIISTVLIHQHYFIDIVVAFIYSVIGIIITKLYKHKLQKVLDCIF